MCDELIGQVEPILFIYERKRVYIKNIKHVGDLDQPIFCKMPIVDVIIILVNGFASEKKKEEEKGKKNNKQSGASFKKSGTSLKSEWPAEEALLLLL